MIEKIKIIDRWTWLEASNKINEIIEFCNSLPNSVNSLFSKEDMDKIRKSIESLHCEACVEELKNEQLYDPKLHTCSKEEHIHDWIEYDREHDGMAIDICRNCTANRKPMQNTNEKESWKVEFDKKYISGELKIDTDETDAVPLKALKDFISSILSNQRSEIEKLLKNPSKAGNILDTESMHENSFEIESEWLKDYEHGYLVALYDIKKKLALLNSKNN